MVDIDGGIGTVFSYRQQGHPRAAQRHRRTSTAASSGSAASGTFVGQHVYTSRPGVAVQINAFNFPVWGMLEKLAPAFLAGLPTIVKPASQTAYLTELVVRRIIESGILPEGSLQLLCGSAGRPARRAPARRTRSRSPAPRTPARTCAQHPSVLHGGVQLGVEADSLNCSILGPDVTAERPGVRPVRQGRRHRDDGQGRPEVHRDPPRDRARRASPTRSPRRSRRGWRRSPSATPPTTASGWARWRSLGQREEVRKAVQALRGSAEIVYGDPDHVDVVDGDAERGAFMSPVLLRAADGRRRAARRRAVRPGQHRAHLRRPRRGGRAGRPRQRQPGRLASSPTTPTSRAP